MSKLISDKDLNYEWLLPFLLMGLKVMSERIKQNFGDQKILEGKPKVPKEN